MAKLSLSGLTMPSAELGPKNPHAALYQPYAPIAHYEGREIPVDHALPYQMLDGYDRELTPKTHRVAVLESDKLRATFLLDLGGRLWSLVHKPTGKELLYVNPVFQPANFGIRNAWFSGGVEWNVGVFGHCVFTCEPVFAAKTSAPDGGDGIRFWEYERTRGVVWQVDVWAPEGSDFLYWSPRIVNPNDTTVPMYWWTCLTVTEEPGGRVLAPATTAMEPDHAMGDTPVLYDLQAHPDLTYPQRRDLPHDTYFEIPAGERPWVAHVSASGEGVVHVSSPLLKGRKQWVWGMEHCGRRWQEWLNPGAPPYIEIQGGLASRQSEYVPMPAGADWSWLEAFGPMAGVDAGEWSRAVGQVKTHLADGLPAPDFDAREAQMREVARSRPVETLVTGTGWGALESARRIALGMGTLERAETPFPAISIGDNERPWLQLLNEGRLATPDKAPGGYVGPEWRGFLGKVTDSWSALLHLGVVLFQQGDRDGARKAWEQSCDLEPNGWAWRNLAVLSGLEGDFDGACRAILTAHALLPDDLHVVDEACRMLAEARDFVGLEGFLNELKEGHRARPRARLARAQVALHQGRLDFVEQYFEARCDLVDIREAETTVSELWRSLCERDTSKGNPAFPPAEWDFRMVH